MRCKFGSKDVQLKLNETICRYKGEPVWVRADGLTLFLAHVYNRGNPFTTIKSNDPEFDIAGPPLGYLQYGDKVFYLTRSAIRRTRQGLDHRAILIRELEFKADKPKRDNGSLIFSQGFHDMVINKYPNLKDALVSIREKHRKNEKCFAEVAVSRNIALGINELGVINVYYKSDHVGWMQPNKDVVHVTSSDKAWIISKYLSDQLGWIID